MGRVATNFLPSPGLGSGAIATVARSGRPGQRPQERRGPTPSHLGISEREKRSPNAGPRRRRETEAAAGPFHIVMMQEADQSFLHDAFRVYHRSGLVIMFNNTFDPGAITTSMERVHESERDKWGIVALASSFADFRSTAKPFSLWFPRTCATLRASDGTLHVSCLSPCDTSCVRRTLICVGVTSTRPTASPTDG